jgi:hypothetical protein
VIENERVYPGDAEHGEAQILDEHEVWCNEVVRLLVGRVRFPAVKKGRHVEREQFRLDHAATLDEGVIAVPILPDDRIILVRQFRHPVRMWLRELPRGGRDKGDRPAVPLHVPGAARRLPARADRVLVHAVGRAAARAALRRRPLRVPPGVRARLTSGGRVPRPCVSG